MALSFQARIQQKKRIEKRRQSFFLLGLSIFFFAFSIYFLLQVRSIQRAYLYPYPYQQVIEEYAKENHIDSTLVAGVIMSESKFKNDVHSHRGAIGLMQLMPSTAEWISHQIDDGNFSVDQLHEPETNIRYGVWYLASLQQEFDNNEILMLAAYNAGRGNVHEWMRENHWDMDFHDIDEIPYEETRAYVMRVLKNQQKYQKLYP